MQYPCDKDFVYTVTVMELEEIIINDRVCTQFIAKYNNGHERKYVLPISNMTLHQACEWASVCVPRRS